MSHQIQTKRATIQHAVDAWSYGSHTATEFAEQKLQLSLERDTAIIKKTKWGVFDLLTVDLLHTDRKKIGLLSQVNEKDSLVLLVSNQNSPLALAGLTVIEGTVLLSEKAIKRANVGRNGFQGEQLVNGEIILKNESLPAISSTIQTEIRQLLAQIPVSVTEKQTASELNETLDIPFDQNTQVIIVPQTLYINQKIKGNCIIIAPKIVIQPTAQVEDALFVAHEIEVEPKAILTGQLLADRKIELKEQAELQFPSAIYLQAKDTSQLIIKPSSLVEGVVVHQSKANSSTTQIGENALVHGQLYSAASTQLKGKVHGSTFVESFYLRTPSTMYRNYLYDAELSQEKKSPYVQVSVLKNELSVNRETIKWVE